MDVKPSRDVIIDLSKQEDFLKKEFDKLNKELEKLLDETRSREKYSISIIAAVAVWIFTNIDNTNNILLRAVSFIPFVTTLMYGISVKFLYENITWIGVYLRRIEDYFLYSVKDNNGNSFGWEKYFDTENKKSRFVSITIGIWCIQILLTIILFVFVLMYK